MRRTLTIFHILAMLLCLVSSFALGRCLSEPSCERKIEKHRDRTGALLQAGKVQIVLDANAPHTTRFAAKELSEILGQVLGADIPVVGAATAGNTPIYLGAATGLSLEGLGNEAFRLQIKSGAIRIAGRDDPSVNVEKDALHGGVWINYHERGTLFGVYGFLEDFAGCDLYFPGRLGTIAPRQSSLALPEADIVDRPDWPGRQFHCYYTSSAYFEGEEPERSAVKHPGKRLQMYRLRMSSEYPLPSLHGLSRMNYVERFANTHPEYFRMKDDGTREAGKRGSWGEMLCFSSNVRNEIFEDWKAMLNGDVSKRPGLEKSLIWGAHRKQWVQRRVVDVMPGDAFVKCNCPECRKQYTDDEDYASNMIWSFTAEIARRLQKEGFEDVVVTQSAYYPYQSIPAFELPSNIQAGVCVTGPWDKYNPRKLEKDNALIRAWSKKLGKKVLLSNYAYKRKMSGVPNITPRAYAEYYSSLTDCIGGVKMMYNETDRFMYTTLQDYIFSKIAWNNQVDTEALFNRYYANMFGKAAPVMRALMERFEDIWLQKIGGRTIETALGPMSSLPSDTEIWTKIYNEAEIKYIETEFDRAEAMENGICKERIQLFRNEYLAPLKKGRQEWSAASSMPEGLVSYLDMPMVLGPHRRGKVAPLKTEVTYSLAEADLTVVFKCQEPRMEARSVAERAKDDASIWQDDSIEIFLNPSGDRKNAFHIIVNSKGVVSDAKVSYIGRNGVHDWAYETGAKAEVAESEGGFSIKVTIPLAGLPDFNRQGFPANFCRSRIVHGEESSLYSWSQLTLSFGDIEHFGLIRFSNAMVKNGSFTAELRRSGWIYKLPESIVRDESVYFSAPASLCISSNGKNESIGQLLPKLTPGRKYRMSCLMKTENVVQGGKVGGACIKLQGKPGHQVWMPRPSLQGTNDWCRYTTEFVADENFSDKVTMSLWIYSGTGKVWFDDISIQELE